jgi:hypothetical protein
MGRVPVIYAFDQVLPNPPAWSHEQVEDAVRSRFPAAHLDLCFFRLTHEWE